MKKAIGLYPCPDIDAAAARVVSHAGAVLLTETIAVTGLGQALSAALARWRLRLAVHDPARADDQETYRWAIAGGAAGLGPHADRGMPLLVLIIMVQLLVRRCACCSARWRARPPR